MDTEEPLIEELDRKQRLKGFFNLKNLLIFLLVFLCLNVIYIDMILTKGLNNQTIIQRFESVSSNTPPAATPNPNICPQSCISQINTAISSYKPVVITPLPQPTNVPIPQANSNTSQIKEYYVPFGSGSGNSSGWQNVPGLQASVDSSAYGSIKSVVFEASLHIPTGNETASVRLYDATQNHPVWNSQIDFNGNTNSVFLASPNISLDSGNNIYEVQIKTQLQYTAILDQSRLHITTQ